MLSLGGSDLRNSTTTASADGSAGADTGAGADAGADADASKNGPGSAVRNGKPKKVRIAMVLEAVRQGADAGSEGGPFDVEQIEKDAEAKMASEDQEAKAEKMLLLRLRVLRWLRRLLRPLGRRGRGRGRAFCGYSTVRSTSR